MKKNITYIVTARVDPELTAEERQANLQKFVRIVRFMESRKGTNA